jgi:cytidine deaminase
MAKQTITRRDALKVLGAAGVSAAMPLSLPADTPAEAELPMTQTTRSKHEDISRILPDLTAASQKRLAELVAVPDYAAHISAADVKSLAANESKSVADLMLALLPLAKTLARPPISNFYVGAVAHGVSGDIYFGANLEIRGQSLGNSVHGEQSAIANCYMHNEEGIAAIAVNEAPCGHCRQFMNELSPERDLQVLVHGNAPTKLSLLLPESFGPKDLGGSGAFPIKKTDLEAPKSSDRAVAAALEAARMSYAPYSKSPSGVALVTRSGRVFKGSYFENAAFNPSLPPLQTALLALIAGGEEFGAITRAVLAEAEHSMITQSNSTETVLSAITPGVKLQVVRASVR